MTGQRPQPGRFSADVWIPGRVGGHAEDDQSAEDPGVAVRWRVVASAFLLTITAAACSGDTSPRASRDGEPAPRSQATGPSTADGPVRVCGRESILRRGPTDPPAGAVVVDAGYNGGVDFSRPGTTYWFAPGVHTIGSGRYDGIVAADDARYVGAPGAVLDGGRRSQYAFVGEARGVTVEYLTIQSFGAVGSNNNEGVVNHDSGEDWTITHNTIRDNAGAGMMLGSGNVARLNCVTRNGQYGFNAYSTDGPSDVTLDRNELSYNNTYDWERKIEGCGCTGGGKFWSVTDATVTDNFVHDNFGVGLWADNNNRGFLIQGNHVSDNADVGIVYETSYNALIRDNTIVRNGLVAGPENPGFPTGGIYVSESGADARVPSRYDRSLDIVGNRFVDNWSGVVLWENADRFCGSPANTSTGECTLVNPKVVTARSCNPGNISREPYVADCRWKTQNVKVHDNTFVLDTDHLPPRCTYARGCGFSAVMSNYGTYPDWSPYKGTVVQKAITFRQGNSFYDNTYRGDWRFMVLEQGSALTFGEWRGQPYGQDQRSRIAAGGTSDPSAAPR